MVAQSVYGQVIGEVANPVDRDKGTGEMGPRMTVNAWSKPMDARSMVDVPGESATGEEYAGAFFTSEPAFTPDGEPVLVRDGVVLRAADVPDRLWLEPGTVPETLAVLWRAGWRVDRPEDRATESEERPWRTLEIHYRRPAPEFGPGATVRAVASCWLFPEDGLCVVEDGHAGDPLRRGDIVGPEELPLGAELFAAQADVPAIAAALRRPPWSSADGRTRRFVRLRDWDPVTPDDCPIW